MGYKTGFLVQKQFKKIGGEWLAGLLFQVILTEIKKIWSKLTKFEMKVKILAKEQI